MKIKFLVLLSCVVLAASCKDEVLPKPKAMLRLEYPDASYQNLDLDCSFSFEKNATRFIYLDCLIPPPKKKVPSRKT